MNGDEKLANVFVIRFEGDGTVDYVLCSPVAQVKDNRRGQSADDTQTASRSSTTWEHLDAMFAARLGGAGELRAKMLGEVQLLAGKAGPTDPD